MQIKLKATGVVGDGLPEAASSTGAVLTAAEGATPASVLQAYGIDVADGFLVTINGEVVVPSAVATRRLNDGDQLTILPPLRGG